MARPSLDAGVRGGNIMLGNVGLTGLSGGASTYSTGATSRDYSLLGKAYTKAQVSGGATPTTDVNTGAVFLPVKTGKSCLFVWGFDSSGNPKVAQGKIVSTTDVTNGAAALEFPEIPDTMCPFAYHSIAHANATDFQFGTSNWNATGVTVGTVVNVVMLGASPLTASS